MTSPDPRFARTRTMHRFTARTATAVAVTPFETYTRLTFSGADFDDWESTGPGDHVKMFFPDPDTGELIAPLPVGPGEDGIVRPDAPMLGRDFTPLNVRVDPASEHQMFDIDFLPHDDAGPAAQWAAQATPGDELVVVGPRGSIAAPAAPRVICVADETALPAAARWLSEVSRETEVIIVVDQQATASETVDWVRSYLTAQGGRTPQLVSASAAPDALAAAVREIGVDDATYVFAGGEAGRLIPLRRLLKHELGLGRDRYDISGYWKAGSANFDHHAPIDPDDPDDAAS